MGYNWRKIKLGDLLVESGEITAEQLNQALEKKKKTDKRLGEILVDEGITKQENIAKALSRQLGLELIDLQNVSIEESILKLIPSSILKKNVVMPYAFKEGKANILKLAMADPLDMQAQEDISIICGLHVEPIVATTRSIMLAIDKYYGQEQVKSVLKAYTRERRLDEEVIDTSSVDINSSPIVTLVRELIENAVRQRASDIHIEPMERSIRVRFRIDGVLHKRVKYSIKALPAIIARIKIISGMDISEKRKPQDGRLTQVVDHVEYDIRVSVIPTVYGEKIVMRLAAKMAMTRDKQQLGLKPYEMEQFNHILKSPHGILLVTGPTGSGKSTTLYTVLSELNSERINIITVEDPIEANIDGINQIQVNPKAELTFANALRAILRQDPDIIMIGEIRDEETARIAVQASITGHLVASTLHTNSAASAITRLEDMGIEPYLIADSVVGIIAQRLVRKLCPACKIQKPATKEEKHFMGIAQEEEILLFKPCGCPKCDNTGYRGRIGVYEIMQMSPTLKEYICSRKSADELKMTAVQEGMRTLRMSASEYVLNGVTSYEEMERISLDL